jgi:hypothetical protein
MLKKLAATAALIASLVPPAWSGTAAYIFYSQERGRSYNVITESLGTAFHNPARWRTPAQREEEAQIVRFLDQ